MNKYAVVYLFMQSLLANSSGRRKFNLLINSQRTELCLDGRSDVELNCALTVSGTDDENELQIQSSAHYVWFHNGSLVVASRDSYVVHEKLVIVKDANQVTSTGTYECIATISGIGSLISPGLRMRAADIRISETNDDTTVRVMVGNTALLRCPKVVAFPSGPLFHFLVNGTSYITHFNGTMFF
ncbi:unnamed protein product [Soboliphyme baturini]|uniref:Ig-like domain-containing protein n=1 Tax=Soboliphyme baturini TaxID=241478 RepID=A0A183J3C3_9BILA|nr:unnamed protein product [Soboliphyme baturini]